LLAAVVPCAGEDLLHRLVSDGPPVVLALESDALAVVAHDDVDALVPGSSEHRHPVSHCLEELGDEELELRSTHRPHHLETPGELSGGRGLRLRNAARQPDDDRHDSCQHEHREPDVADSNEGKS